MHVEYQLKSFAFRLGDADKQLVLDDGVPATGGDVDSFEDACTNSCLFLFFIEPQFDLVLLSGVRTGDHGAAGCG